MNADELRMAVKEVLCDSGKEWQQYEEALVAITVEESLKRLDANLTADSQSSFILLVFNFLIDSLAYPYDDNLSTSAVTANTFNDLIFREESQSFWLVLSRLDGQPIVVYIPEHEHRNGGWGSGFIPIAEYGSEFRKGSRKGKPRKVVKLFYSCRNHYDLLV
ncbi:hypothetical protein REPUB_Repub03eG0131600 [Reevesia pubescens]